MLKLASQDAWSVGGCANGFAKTLMFGGGDGIDVLGLQQDLDPNTCARHVANWVATIARLLGCCCENGPDHIPWARDLIAEMS